MLHLGLRGATIEEYCSIEHLR
ncbi:unnamed protein product [Lathyrus sativus]|nr:unnamed protein product [Lathyrus sativus]